MNSLFNLLRAPLQANLQCLKTFSTVSNFIKLPLPNSQKIGFEFLRPVLKESNGNSILSQRCSQQNPVISRAYHVLTKKGDEPLNNTLNSAYDKVSLSGVFSMRTKIRVYFPNPNEWKRIKKHGWAARMRTKAGREIIMRRILKGRHCITH